MIDYWIAALFFIIYVVNLLLKRYYGKERVDNLEERLLRIAVFLSMISGGIMLTVLGLVSTTWILMIAGGILFVIGILSERIILRKIFWRVYYGRRFVKHRRIEENVK